MGKEPEASKALTFLGSIDGVLTRPLGRPGSQCGKGSSSPWKGLIRCCRGLTILELMVTMMGFATLMAIVLPVLDGAQEDLRVFEAVTDITVIQFEITTYELKYGTIPPNIAAMNIPEDTAIDPWGLPYVYLNYANPDPPDGEPRQDQFLKPVNTAYDIYSMGPNGETHKNLSNWRGKDDIVRASDGEFIGVAEEF